MPNPRAGEKQDNLLAAPHARRPHRGTQVFNLFRRSKNAALIDRLHGEIMAAARQPAFFTQYGAADTVEGRFEVLSLMATLAILRMEELPEPGPSIAQDTTDALFRHFDIALREIGVGDVSVPKKMKKMAQGYLGRAGAYRAALHDEAELARAVARNVLGDESRAGDAQSVRFARYARAQAAAFASLDVETVLKGPLAFLDADSIE
ncbi:MAG: ubiquinol-cytochrome c chaperone [Hyphomicrobiales bacterium]|nr:ubiquinol-cytochrome c chaperone [Hyphomicrobiales bacterium]